MLSCFLLFSQAFPRSRSHLKGCTLIAGDIDRPSRDLEDEQWMNAFGLMVDMLKTCSHDQPHKIPERVRDMRVRLKKRTVHFTDPIREDFSSDAL